MSDAKEWEVIALQTATELAGSRLEIAALKAEAELARMRLGPAGYKILEEHKKLREALERIVELGPSAINAHQAYTIAKETLRDRK
jgi:hypothetical protein